MDVWQFRRLIVGPTLDGIGLYSPAALNLVLGTAIQESRLMYIEQLGGGPALGVYQMEPATHDDIWENYLRWRLSLNAKARKYAAESAIPGATRPQATQMVWNLRYATTMCRLHYYRAPFRFDERHADEASYLAGIWKRWYNTDLGAGTVEEFIRNWDLAMR